MAEFVSYSERATYQLHQIPPDILEKLDLFSHSWDRSYGEVIARSLADCHGFKYVESNRPRPSSQRPSTSVSVRVPVKVMNKIRRQADREKITIRSVILNCLASHFGLVPPPVTHVSARPGRPRKEP